MARPPHVLRCVACAAASCPAALGPYAIHTPALCSHSHTRALVSVHCLLMARLKPVCTFVCTIRSRSTLNRRRPPQLSSSSMQPGSANAASSCEDAHWLMRTQVDWVGSWKAQCAWPTAAMEWCGEPPVPPLRTPAWGYARRRDSGHPVDVRYGHVWEGKNGLRQEFFWPRNEVPKYTLKTRGKNFTATARIVDMREQSDGTFPAVAQPTHGVDLPGCDGQLPTETGLGCIRGEWVGGVGGMVVRAAGAEKGRGGVQRVCVCAAGASPRARRRARPRRYRRRSRRAAVCGARFRPRPPARAYSRRPSTPAGKRI